MSDDPVDTLLSWMVRQTIMPSVSEEVWNAMPPGVEAAWPIEAEEALTHYNKVLAELGRLRECADVLKAWLDNPTLDWREEAEEALKALEGKP